MHTHTTKMFHCTPRDLQVQHERSLPGHPESWLTTGPIRTRVFENGAGVVCIHIPTMKSYLSEIVFGCASDYELTPNMFGLAHFLEHLKCKPTPGGLDRWDLQSGSYQNASTTNGRTDYYALLPGHALKQSIDIYAQQQMCNEITQAQVDEERFAVLNELQRGQADPMRMIQARVGALSNLHSHEGYHTTIGFEESIMNAKAEDLNDFANKFYTTDRVTYVVAGDFGDHAFRDDIMQYVQNIWGGMPKTTCAHSRLYMKTHTAVQETTAHTMFVDQPGYNFLMMQIPTVHANDKNSIACEVVATALNDGILREMRESSQVGCAEAAAQRTMARTPTMTIAMNCAGDVQQARSMLLTRMANAPKDWSAYTTTLRSKYTSVFSDAAKFAELIPESLSFCEGCGALAAHDLIARINVLSELTHDNLNHVWNVVTERLATSCSTVHAISRDLVRLPNMQNMNSARIEWGDTLHSPEDLSPNIVEYSKRMSADMHPIRFVPVACDQAYLHVRIASQSMGYKHYLRMLTQNAPGSTTCTTQDCGDYCTVVMQCKWEQLKRSTRWFVSALKAQIDAHVAQRTQASMAMHTPQAAVDFNADVFMGYSSDRNASVQSLRTERQRVIRSPMEITLYAPTSIRGDIQTHIISAAMTSIIPTLRTLRLVAPVYGRPQKNTIPDGGHLAISINSPISVCTIKIPTTDMRGPQLAALSVANAALGGDFNSMLMKEVRVKRGLTYSASSSVRLSPMHIHITSTFAPERYEAGLQALQDVVQQWKSISREQFKFGQHTVNMRMQSLVDIPQYAIGHDSFLQHIGMDQNSWKQCVEACTHDDVVNIFAHIHFNKTATVISHV